MPIKILLAIPTLNRLDRLTRMLETVALSTRQPDHVLLVNNGGQITDAHRRDWQRLFPLSVYTPHTNLGVAGSVNFAMRNTPEGWWWLHANDDVTLAPDCIELMEAAAIDDPTAFIVPEHAIGSAFTVFMLQSSIRDRVGYFDEVFNPVYHEDDSMGRRMNLAGIPRSFVKNAFYEHAVSSTVKAYTPEQLKQHHENFRRNEREFIRMWGGPTSAPVFEIPYNGRFGHTLENRAHWAVHTSPREEDALWP